MNTSRPLFQKYLFVCENEREEGACCAKRGSRILREVLKHEVKEQGLASKIRVSRTGCLAMCREGANVLLMPDNVWFKGVREEDVPEIMRKAAEGVVS